MPHLQAITSLKIVKPHFCIYNYVQYSPDKETNKQLEGLLGSMELLQESVKGLEGAVEQIQGDTHLCCNNSDPNATSGNECVCVHVCTCAYDHM